MRYTGAGDEEAGLEQETIPKNRIDPRVHPAAMGSTSRIVTYRHHPKNRPKAKNPPLSKEGRPGSFRGSSRHTRGISNSNRRKYAPR
jgi:hypothetical protein